MPGLWGLAALLAACGGPVQHDAGVVCAYPEPGQVVLQAHSDDCSADHAGAAFSCEATVDGTTVTVHTTLDPGRDANDKCAGPLTAECTASVAEGDVTVIFAGAEATLSVPDGASACLPDGGAGDTGG